jgi:O-antigen/teichoic acid export membrane protein
MTAVSVAARRPPRIRLVNLPSGVSWVVAAEVTSGALGFLALVVQARRLGPASFAGVESATALAAWMLVVVRGGADVIVYREAARRPRLIARLTDLLLGLRLLAACLGYAVVLGLAALAGSERGPAVLVAGLILFASAWNADVGIRATGRLGWVASAQVIRALGYLAFTWGLVQETADATLAALGLVVAEGLAAVVTLVSHVPRWGFPRPRLHLRPLRVLIHRGLIAGLARFGRVTVYGGDMLILGICWWTTASLGPYAAARRVVFALVAIGIVVPSVLGPQIARAWASGTETTRTLLAQAIGGLLGLAIPATLGLALTADRWMPLLFGPAYQEGGPWLALVVARLPWLLVATIAQAVLVACRREVSSLRHVLGMLVLACVLIPIGLVASGPWGVGWAVLAVEAAGAVAGCRMLGRLGILPGCGRIFGPIAAGSVGLLGACWMTGDGPLGVVCVAGALAYGSVWWGVKRGLTP